VRRGPVSTSCSRTEARTHGAISQLILYLATPTKHGSDRPRTCVLFYPYVVDVARLASHERFDEDPDSGERQE
jgi:hypothetical protein